jgi:hypothetical protein
MVGATLSWRWLELRSVGDSNVSNKRTLSVKQQKGNGCKHAAEQNQMPKAQTFKQNRKQNKQDKK